MKNCVMLVGFSLCLGVLSCGVTSEGPDEVGLESLASALTLEQCLFFQDESKITVCHRTLSEKNPWVIIRINQMGCGGHEEHADDWIDTTDACAADARYCCQEKGCFPEGAPYDGSVDCCEDLVILDGKCSVPPAPVVVADSYLTREDEPLTVAAEQGVLANDSAANGRSLTATVFDGPWHGTLTLQSDGALVYTPDSDYNGEDTFRYVAFDGLWESEFGTVVITVTAVNDAPSFKLKGDLSVISDGPIQTFPGHAYDISAGPADESDQTLWFHIAETGGPFWQWPALAPDGTLTFGPSSGASGSKTIDVYLFDSGEDANGGVNYSHQTFVITLTPPNREPSANNISVETHRDTPIEITLDGTDPDGDPLTYSLVSMSGLPKGSLSAISGNKITYTPPRCFTGQDWFRYRTFDGMLYSPTSGLVTITVSIPAPVIHRVDIDAIDGQNDGTSWADAFTDLHTALAVACPFDEIWVAEGTYKAHETDRLVSFQLREDVYIYGGFGGTESLRTERSWVEHPTILSGELGDVAIVADNTEHILLGANGAILDGFTVTRGYTSGSYGQGAAMLNNNIARPLTIANCRFTESSGNPAVRYTNGAVANNSSVVHITDCTFVDNHFTYAGALANESGNVTVSRCSFISNSAIFNTHTDGRGGAVRNAGGTSAFVDCWFEENYGAAFGGAIHIDYGAQSTYDNCVFFHNGGSMHGGAINIAGTTTVVSITNSVFVGNYTSVGSGYACGRAIALDGSVVTVQNTIFRGNVSTHGPDIGDYWARSNCQPNQSDRVLYSNLEFPYGYPVYTTWPPTPVDPSNLLKVDPLFVDAANPRGADGIPMTADDGLALQPVSPCINKGNDAAASSADILGNSRPNPGAAVDMGAYESQSSP